MLQRFFILSFCLLVLVTTQAREKMNDNLQDKKELPSPFFSDKQNAVLKGLF